MPNHLGHFGARQRPKMEEMTISCVGSTLTPYECVYHAQTTQRRKTCFYQGRFKSFPVPGMMAIFSRSLRTSNQAQRAGFGRACGVNWRWVLCPLGSAGPAFFWNPPPGRPPPPPPPPYCRRDRWRVRHWIRRVNEARSTTSTRNALRWSIRVAVRSALELDGVDRPVHWTRNERYEHADRPKKRFIDGSVARPGIKVFSSMAPGGPMNFEKSSLANESAEEPSAPWAHRFLQKTLATNEIPFECSPLQSSTAFVRGLRLSTSIISGEPISLDTESCLENLRASTLAAG